jgi:threonine dehydratase
VARAFKRGLPVYAVQAAGASAIHDAWHLGRPVSKPSADTFADGLATRNTYPFTFGALREGLAGFVAVTDAEIAEAVRLLLSTTHTLVEGAGAAGLAGLLKLGDTLAGRTVGIVLSGANIDRETLRRVLAREI